MPNFDWLGAEAALTAAALTVRVQTIPLDDLGMLLWPNFAPRRDVDAFEFRSISDVRFRPTAERREWNARGRLIPIRTPGSRQISWVPIEAYFKIDEEEINRLLIAVRGNQTLFRDEIRVQVPQRTDDLATANLRRIELDFFQAWLQGTITQKNPQTASTQTIPLGLDATRYETAATAWNNGAVNAYTELINFLTRAIAAVGPIIGAAMRIATFTEIQNDAPALIVGSTIKPNRAQIEAMITEQIGMPFRFYIIEQTVDVFNDAGTDVSTQKVFTSQRVAVIPAGGVIGETLFAPVARAYDIAAQVPNAKIDIRGQTVFYEASNGGRELTVECQVNAFSNPIERFVYVINAGV
jgi:hypothetical protein